MTKTIQLHINKELLEQLHEIESTFFCPTYSSICKLLILNTLSDYVNINRFVCSDYKIMSNELMAVKVTLSDDTYKRLLEMKNKLWIKLSMKTYLEILIIETLGGKICG